MKQVLSVICLSVVSHLALSAATPGEWSYSRSAAEALADTWDRPLIIKFSNSSGACSLCNSFEKHINSCDYWKAYASEQQLALHYIDYNRNWDMECYLKLVSNNPSVKSFPAFAVYASDGKTLLSAFTYSASEPYTAEAFVQKINAILAANGYLLQGNDLWDPLDNTPTGATLLNFKLYNQRQYHDLNETADDTVDWFKFACGRNQRYKLHLPPADYNIDFRGITDSFLNSVTNNFHEATTNLFSAPSVTNRYYSAATNLISVTTNLVITSQGSLFPLTNALPRLVEVSRAALAPRTTTATVVRQLGPYTATTPGAPPLIVTNGVPQELLAPSLQIFDAGFAAPLDFTLGDSAATTNLALLNQLEDGLLFTPQQPCSGDYYFIRIGQELEGELPFFETVEYYDLTTNTTVTVQTNITETAVVTTTTTNVTSYWITYTGVTNFVAGLPPEPMAKVDIITNQISEVFSSVVSNYTAETAAKTSTRQEIYEGSNYVFYSYSRTQYTLNYRLWEPGTIAFEKPALTQRESADSVRVRVLRQGGATGAVRFNYDFEDVGTAGMGYTAENGSDFNGVGGELLWADGDDSAREIVVPLIQDVVPLWEGDETFAVVIAEHADAAVLQAELDGDRCVVTLRESAKRHPGTVAFAGSSADDASDPLPFAAPGRPEVAFREGESITLWLQRSKGSDGAIAVRVTTGGGTAREELSFDPVDEVVTWPDGDAGLKPVTIDTFEVDGFTGELYFYAEIKNAQDAKLGSARKVTLRLRDASVARTLGDTETAAGEAGLVFRNPGNAWFWNDAAALQCAPLTGGRRELALTLSGPGVLSFDWRINDAVPGDALTLAGGVALPKTLAADGPSVSALVPFGRQTLTWTLTAAAPADDRDLYAVIENMIWQPVPAAFAPLPSDRALTFGTDLSWRMPQSYAVAVDGDFAVDEGAGLPLDARAAALSPSGNTVDGVAATTHFALWGEDEPRPGQTYRWQATTRFSHADGDALNPGDIWSYKGIAGEDAQITELPPDGFGASELYEAVQGVFADFGEIYDGEDGMTVRLAGGSLPAGLSMDAKTGRIAGVPSRAGSWSILIQASASIDRRSVAYATVPLTIRVNAAERFPGKYAGWMQPTTGALSYFGGGSLALDDRGRLSAKFSVGGETLAFSQSGADGVDDPVDPAEMRFDSVAGPSVTDAGGTRFYSALNDLILHADGGGTAVLTHYSATGSGASKVVTERVFNLLLRRNDWHTASMQPLAAAFEGYYTVLLPVAETRDLFAPWGSGFLTLTVDRKGSVKAGGMLADGTRLSLNADLLYFGDPPPGPDDLASEEAVVYLFSQPRGYKGIGGVSGFLRITAGLRPEDNIIDIADAPMQWWNYNPLTVYGGGGVAQSETTGFLNAIAPAGGFYDRRTNLKSFYLGRELTFEDSADWPAADRLPADNDGYEGVSGYLLYADILPFGTPLIIEASRLTTAKKQIVGFGNDPDGGFDEDDFDDDDAADEESEFDNIDVDASVNLNKLSISMNSRSGLIKGGFELYYERENQNGSFSQRTRKLQWNGAITRNHPEHAPDPHDTGIQGGGFYLLRDSSSWLDEKGRTKKYTFDWSCPFELQSAGE